MSLRDEILSTDDLPKAAVIVREWNNATVYIRSITSAERAGFDRDTLRRRRKSPDRIRVLERLVILCAQDEHGAPLFKPEDEDALAAKSTAAITKIFRIASKHNGFTEEEEDEGANP